MALQEEIDLARRQVVTDGYDMSIGEIINLYKNKEMKINPEFQRLFRWDLGQKTRFIESLILGIPIPPIFVYQTNDGVWELVDGLQRISTILEFVGELLNEDEEIKPASVLEGTKLLPSLSGKYWKRQHEEEDNNAFTIPQQLQLKRERIRVEILKMGSDNDAKYELFQRLNTGGSTLTYQEIRNCVMVMINPEFYSWIKELTNYPSFTATVQLSGAAQQEQKPMEMALRFLTYRNIPYDKKIDLNEYLDTAAVQLSKMTDKKRDVEEMIFKKTFDLLSEALGSDAFKKWDGSRFSGAFSVAAFDVVGLGLSINLEKIIASGLDNEETKEFIITKTKLIWEDVRFIRNSGMGVRGTTRLINLLPISEEFYSI